MSEAITDEEYGLILKEILKAVSKSICVKSSLIGNVAF